MGIKNMSQFLKKYDVMETLHISSLKYTKLGIDTPLYLFKFKGITDPSSNDWLGCFATFVAFLRKHDIHPIFIFEGKAPPEKAPIQEERKQQRQKVTDKTTTLEEDLNKYESDGTISKLLLETMEKLKHKNNKSLLTKKTLIKSKLFINVDIIRDEIKRRKQFDITITVEDINHLKELFNLMGVNWIQSKGEAETDCVSLFYDDVIDYILSEDTDVLAYFNPKNEDKELKVITNLNTGNLTFTQISKTRLLETLNLTSFSFRDFCIMCGTDYNKNIPRVGIETSYKFINKYYKIEHVPIDATILNYVRGREMFTVKSNPKLHSSVKWCRLPDVNFMDNLNVFMFTFNLKNINKTYIFNALTEPDIDFEFL